MIFAIRILDDLGGRDESPAAWGGECRPFPCADKLTVSDWLRIDHLFGKCDVYGEYVCAGISAKPVKFEF